MTTDDETFDESTCSVAGCPTPADTVATLVLRLNPLVGAAAEDDPMMLEIPLCGLKHAHLLRMGADMVDLRNGLNL